MVSQPHASSLLVILGPTASGKTRLGVELARRLDGEIISADSRQVYRGMDLGTGKDLEEFDEVPYHLIDIVDPGHEFNLFEFQRRFIDAYHRISTSGRLPILVGGSGLYLEAVLCGYRLQEAQENPLLRRELEFLTLDELAARLKTLRPTLHNSTDLTERDRLIRAIEIASAPPAIACEPLPPLHPFVFGIRWERSILRQRITARLKARLAAGMVAEVERLLAAGVPDTLLEFYGLEYRFVARHLRGELNRNDMFQKLNSAIHDFAKRQETWFRRMERNGTQIHWLDGAGDPLGEALLILDRFGREKGGGGAGREQR